MRFRSVAAILALASLASAPTAFAAERAIDAAKSSISAEFTQMSVPVNAPFKKFSGGVDLDPAKPAEARAHFDIDTASFDIGDDDYNAEVRKPEWFDTAKFPKASFVASGLKPTTPGNFEASGKLSLKGKTVELKVPVTTKTEGGMTTYSGAVSISRKAFAIGSPSWDDTVEDTVKIRFRIAVPAAG
ncbi:YceI family protein [Nevskia ramosa]|uniref:YceI family protein n=1 Tax=Nevskia ramosa TaxID=64002 RepID=UPI0003B5F861|nr:YceI family protein [Nevskia ramosa]